MIPITPIYAASDLLNHALLMLGPAQYVVVIVTLLIFFASFSALFGAKIRSLIIVMVIGFFIGLIGINQNTGASRFTFNIEALDYFVKYEAMLALIIGSMFLFLIRLSLLGKAEFRFSKQKYIPYYVAISAFMAVCLLLLSLLLSLGHNLFNEFYQIAIFSFFFIFGLAIRYFKLPLIPLLLSINVATFLEENYMRALLINRGDFWKVFGKMFSVWFIYILFIASISFFIVAYLWRRKHELKSHFQVN